MNIVYITIIVSVIAIIKVIHSDIINRKRFDKVEGYLNTLYNNQQKILELSSLKNFIQLVNEEEKLIKKDIVKTTNKPERKESV